MNQVKSICFFNGNKPWGGGEKWHYDFALLMRDAGWRVFAVTNDPSELHDRLRPEPGITLLQMRMGNTSFLNPLKVLRLWRFFRSNRIDAVVMALPSDMKLGSLAAKLAGVGQIIYRRGLAVPIKDKLLNRLLLRHAVTRLIVNSEETGRMILANNPDMVAPEKMSLVHCGFDVAEFDARAGADQPLVERRPGEVLIGNAGRLTRQKGQGLLIEAARLLKDRGLNFRVVVAGKGEMEQELKDKARELDVEDRVVFLGFVRNMKAFHESIDIFALSSLWEGFCYAQVEAMTLRRPVVAFNVSSIPEVVSDSVTGLLAPAGDVEAFAGHLERLIRDPELRRELGEQGRRRVIEHFELKKTLADFEQVVQGRPREHV
jgi:glycosyltransferase involved in cell wall biosynthesis